MRTLAIGSLVLAIGSLASGCLRNKFDACLQDPPTDPYCVDADVDAGSDAAVDAPTSDDAGTDGATDAATADAGTDAI